MISDTPEKFLKAAWIGLQWALLTTLALFLIGLMFSPDFTLSILIDKADQLRKIIG